MTDVDVGPLVQNIVYLLRTEFTWIGGVKKDVKRLARRVSTIQAVLEGTEAMQFKEKSTVDYLAILKDAVYDGEDALDLWLTTARQRELELTDTGSSNQVSSSIPTCLNFKQIILRYKIAKRVKEIISKIDDIAKQKFKVDLNFSTVPQTEYICLEQKRETDSKLIEPKIYGRGNDKKNIIDKLLSNESQEDLSVFPLVGFGGVGKTTLAQFVYNDERVVGRFETRVWVCVYEPFDVKRILKAIIESLPHEQCNLENLKSIRAKVQELLKDKKYLLVLDDVWNENQDKWNRLKSVINIGAKGSSVVVTTRLTTVADITATIPPYHVGFLSDDDCWSLLKDHALGDKDEEQYPNLVSIGKYIAKRCKGVPLAAKSLGRLLCSKTEVNHWINVRDSEIWKLEGDILPALRLSYDHLPRNLKPCFSYCSIFPKDHVIDKTNLIFLWMANGFIQPRGNMELEEIGEDIFNELLRRSFFQDTTKDQYGNIETCKMHDLMHDLACFVALNDCQIVYVHERQDVRKRIRHLTMILDSKQSSTTIKKKKKKSSTTIDPCFLGSHPSLRTLLFLCSPNNDELVFPPTLRVLDISCTGMMTLSSSVYRLKLLRYLNLSNNNLKSLPKSICSLVNLQMLDLSENREFETLPHSIGNLTNLRHLNLNVCSSLESLPETVCDLRNLRSLLLKFCDKLKELPKNMKVMRRLIHLEVLGCLTLRKLPAGIGELKSLQTLSYFPVGDDSDRDGGAAGISELQGLNQLRGDLIIEGLENVRHAEEATKANLRSKQYLTTLELTWS